MAFNVHYLLLVTMAVSLLWGSLLLVLGLIIHFDLGMIISNYVHGLESRVQLKAYRDRYGHNLCPTITEVPNSIDLGDWSRTLGDTIAITAFTVVIFSTFGLVAAAKQTTSMLLVLLAVIVFTTLGEIYLIWMLANENATFHLTARHLLVEILESRYKIQTTEDLFTMTLNSIMLTGKCCGINGVRDFSNTTYTEIRDSDEKKVNSYTLIVPLACCKQNRFTNDTIESGLAFQSLLKCAMKGSPSDINLEGCYHSVYNYLAKTRGAEIMALLIFLVLWQCVQMGLVVVISIQPPRPILSSSSSRKKFKRLSQRSSKTGVSEVSSSKDHQDSETPAARHVTIVPPPSSVHSDQRTSLPEGWSPTTGLERAEDARSDTKTPLKYVIPHSKMSPISSANVHRIKSTEIW